MKSGLDYFPLDVHLDQKWDLLEAEYGIKGFGVVVKLFQEIYGQEGYYLEWTRDVALLFGRKTDLGESVVSEIVCAAVKRGIFDEMMFNKYGILTSRGIQMRYFEAVSRRKEISAKSSYLLVQCNLLPTNVNISGENVNISGKNANISKQSKVEKSKEEKSNISCSEQSEIAREPVVKLPLIDGSWFKVYEDDIKHYSELYQAVDVSSELRKMVGWLESHQRQRKTSRGIKAFITAWLSKAQDRGGSSGTLKSDYRNPDRYKDIKGSDYDDIFGKK